MKIYFLIINRIMFFLVSLVANFQLNAQSTFVVEDSLKLHDEILTQDSLFWKAYNMCDLDKLQTFFTNDLEFYHDKGGLTTTLTNFMNSLKNGICSNENIHVRREVVEGSLSIYPIPGYGALLAGEHVFYIKEEDKKERLDGKARFLHVWQFKNNQWKMSRVFSYEHMPVEYEPLKTEITIPVEILTQFSGNYKSLQTGMVIITKDADHLLLQSGGFHATLFPESEDTFFIKERDVQFKFIKDTKNSVLKLTVIENGEVVDEAIKIK